MQRVRRIEQFVCADWHFNHKKIAEYTRREDGWQELIIRRTQERVALDDVLFCLGDCILGYEPSLRSLLERMPGRKILIRGNHDRHMSDSKLRAAGFDAVCDMMVIRRVLLSHKPVPEIPSWIDFNIHGHLHNADIPQLSPQHIRYSPENEDYYPRTIEEMLAPKRKVPNGTYVPLRDV